MSEERFETWLKENADDYHRPPANVPRDEMWEHITRARQASSARMAGHIGPRVSPMRYAVAASLIMGAGIGLGYWLRGGSDATPAPSVATVTPAQDSAIRNVTYEFEPHGLVFQKAIRVEQDAGLTSLVTNLLFPRIRGAYFEGEPSGSTATVKEFRPTFVDLLRGRIIFTVEHFSGYLLAIG